LNTLPDRVDGLEGLAFLLQLQGRAGEALPYRRRLLLQHIRGLGVDATLQSEATTYLLAGEGRVAQPEQAPSEYVRCLFDRYAIQFDADLVDRLHYDGPELLYDTLRRSIVLRPGGLDVLDIGCGTGLAGAVFRPVARTLDGLDLSQAMLERAEARGIYDRLDQGEIVAELTRLSRCYDLVVAADVLIYFGDLIPVFTAVRGVLKDRGHFVFSVEKGDADGFRLRSTGRYQHHPDYVKEVADGVGLETLHRREATMREQDNQPVTAFVFVLRQGSGNTA
jgi:predicted TPR repeat methyltransferase